MGSKAIDRAQAMNKMDEGDLEAFTCQRKGDGIASPAMRPSRVPQLVTPLSVSSLRRAVYKVEQRLSSLQIEK